MHRLFVALRPPAQIRSALLGIMGGIAGARWQDDDQLHVTLRFIGEVETRVAEDIAATLSTVKAPPVHLAMAGVGQFDKRGRSHTLWAGITPQEPLARLHRKIDVALQGIGFMPDSRAYVPHITLARLNLPLIALERFLTEHHTLASPPFTLEQFLLCESRLGRDGARYDAVARYPLRD